MCRTGKSKLVWFGHVKIMGEEILPKQIMNLMEDGRRQEIRPELNGLFNTVF